MQVKEVLTWCTGSRWWLQEDACDRFLLHMDLLMPWVLLCLNASNFCLQIMLLQEAGPVACNPGTCNPGVVLNLVFWAAAMWNLFEWCKCCHGEQPWVSIAVVSIHLNVVRVVMSCWLVWIAINVAFVTIFWIQIAVIAVRLKLGRIELVRLILVIVPVSVSSRKSSSRTGP